MNQNEPLVSVIMPCYNHEKYVADSLESIFNQTYPHLEVIIANNGSTDHTGEIIRQYQDKIDKLIEMDANDIAACEELLYSSCTGDYIAMAHSDDWWEPQKIEKQLQALSQHKDCGACFTWAFYTTEDLNTLIDDPSFLVRNKSRNEWQRTLLVYGNCLSHPSLLIEKDRMLELRAYMNVLPRLGDWHTWLELLRTTNIYILEEGLVKMRRHEKNISAINATNCWADRIEQSYMMERVCTVYTDTEFADIFRADFVNPNASTTQELYCEKLLLLLRIAAENPFMVSGAHKMFCEGLIRPDVREVLKNTYHYDRMNLWNFEYDNNLLHAVHTMYELQQRENWQMLTDLETQLFSLLDMAEKLRSRGQIKEAKKTILSMQETIQAIQTFLEQYAQLLTPNQMMNLRACQKQLQNPNLQPTETLFRHTQEYLMALKDLRKQMEET